MYKVIIFFRKDLTKTYHCQVQDSRKNLFPTQYFTYSNFRYPVGMGLAMCSSRRLPLEENNFMDFSMPILFVLAEDGLLCGYYAVNQLPNAVQITKPNGAPSMDNIRNGSIIIPKSLKGII